MSTVLSRRSFFGGVIGTGLAVAAAPKMAPAAGEKRFQGGKSPWPLALNASTIRPATLLEKVDAAAAAGWDALEPWIDDLEKYEAEKGSLKTLAAQIKDKGLYVNNVIGLWECMPQGEEAFQASLPATRERMRRCSEVGSQFVAAIPAPDRADFDLVWGAHCYRELMRIGREDYNIRVAFEFVGFMKGIYRFGTATGIALDTNDPNACLIMDTFHLFRGDSGFNCIKLIQGDLIANFHINDVRNDVPREQQGDEHREYPGDGALPLPQLFKDLKAIGFQRTLSLEIFKRDYWKMDPKQVAVTGKQKVLECIAAAGV